VNTVRIVHPEAGEARVAPSAVPHWRSSGWEQAEEPPAEKQAKKPPAKKPVSKEETPRGRRATNGDED
jgi:hypothetical protein